MTACAAKFSSSPICLSVKGRVSRREIAKAPTGVPSFQRNKKAGAGSAECRCRSDYFTVGLLRHRIEYLDQPLSFSDASYRIVLAGIAVLAQISGRLQELGSLPSRGSKLHLLAVERP